VGGAAAQTLAVAERLGADVIVVGAHPGGLLRGHCSLSDRVARRARCEVLVVREP
jgi:nucleotide-binding universal stress UspA family protein